MIRHALPTDIPAIVDLCERFASEHPLSTILPFDKAYVYGGIETLIDNPTTFIAVATTTSSHVVGCIIGISIPFLYNPTQTMVSELVWYIHPDHRRGSDALRLLTALEEWAISRDALAIIMVSYETGSDVSSLYTRRGYVCTEHQWLKPL